MTAAVLAVLADFRPEFVRYEDHLQARIAAALDAAGIPYVREARLDRYRIDFLVDGGLGIEVKKGKPSSAAVREQVKRYCGFPEVNELVLVVERNVFDVPDTAAGKKVHYVAINGQGGVAL